MKNLISVVQTMAYAQNRKNRPNHRVLRTEFLEERTLLSAVPLTDAEYLDLAAQYSALNLPETREAQNVITLDLSEGDGLSSLKSAIAEAGTTAKSDLIVVRTGASVTTGEGDALVTDHSANTLTYTSASDEITINIDSRACGSITIVSLGTALDGTVIPLTLDANTLSRVLTVAGTNTVVNLGGLTITGGTASRGGGINNAGTLNLSNVILSKNKASDCGAAIDNAGKAYLYDCISQENSANWGAGLDSWGTTVVERCIIRDNTATNGGGGINTGGGVLTVSNSLIESNKSSNGGGFRNGEHGGTQTFTNCVFVDNSATNGGAIYQGGYGGNGISTFLHCTITGNEATTNGGGIYRNSGTLNLNNSIVTMNYASSYVNVYGVFSATSANNETTYNPLFVCGPVFDASGNLTNADALDLHLSSDSPLINSLEDGYIGAYEFTGEPTAAPMDYSVVTTLDDEFDLTNDVISLREAVWYVSEADTTITFAESLFTEETPTGTILLNSQLYVDKPMTIDGAGRVTLDGQDKTRIIKMSRRWN